MPPMDLGVVNGAIKQAEAVRKGMRPNPQDQQRWSEPIVA